MPNRSSRRRAKPFVNPSERFAHERMPGGPEPLEIKLGGDTTRHYRDGKLHSTTTKPAAAPTAPPSAPKPSSGPPRRPSHLRRNVAIGVGATAAVGGGAYLVHRHRQRSKTVTKNLVDPFSEVVAFGKAYPRALPIPGARPVRAMIPTGRHVGDANALVHRTIKPKGHRQGPFSKGMPKFLGGGARTGGEKILNGLFRTKPGDVGLGTKAGITARNNAARVQNGLNMATQGPSSRAKMVTRTAAGRKPGAWSGTGDEWGRSRGVKYNGLAADSPLRGTGSQTGSSGRRLA